MCSCTQNIFSLHAGMKKVKGGIVGISQDYNAVKKWAMTVNLRVAVHANFKDICKKQEKRKEKQLSRITTRKSKLKNIITGSVVGSKHLNDILGARVKGKEHLYYFINERFFEEKISF